MSLVLGNHEGTWPGMLWKRGGGGGHEFQKDKGACCVGLPVIHFDAHALKVTSRSSLSLELLHHDPNNPL